MYSNSRFADLNTLYVDVELQNSSYYIFCIDYLNTLYVDVEQKKLLYLRNKLSNLNTLYVDVELTAEPFRQSVDYI